MIDEKILAAERVAVQLEEGSCYEAWERRRAEAETVEVYNVVPENVGVTLSDGTLGIAKFAAMGGDGFWFCTAQSKTACIKLARAIGLKVRS